MNGLLANLNPFDSALASAMTAESATAIKDIPLDAVAANSVAPSLPAERAGVAAGQIPAPGPVPAATSNSLPEPAPQAPATSMPGVETTAGDTGENIVSSPAAFSSNKTAAIAVWEKTNPKMAQAIREMPGDTYLPPKEWLPELFPEYAPAAFSLDLRIHNIMLAVADELADEQRAINERLLLRQFARQT